MVSCLVKTTLLSEKGAVFALLRYELVIRAWGDTLCDGAVFCGDQSLPVSYIG